MIIELLNGTSFDTADYDLKRLFHFIPSAVIDHTSSSVEGRPDIILNSQLKNRVIRVQFLYEATDIYDYYLLRDELNNLFMRTESFYITFKREPYKRWLVKVAGQFEVPPAPHMNAFTVEFITVNGYAESTLSTSDVDVKEWDIDKFAWNGVIDWDSNYSYSNSSNRFDIFNLGNVPIDPTFNDLKIMINANASQSLQIVNTTNNTSYFYTKPLAKFENLIVDGIRSTKDGVSVFGNTDRKLITLEPGVNSLVVTGSNDFNISFDFKFLYK